MRILFDHQSYSLQITGGITRYLYELAKNFNQQPGVVADTQLGFCTTVWPLEEASRPRGKVLHWGERLVPNGVGTWAINEVFLGAYNLLQPKVDIYHNTLYRFMPTIRARAYVATHHDCTIERFPHLFREADMVIKAKRGMLKKADMVFCVSNASREDLLHFYDYPREQTIALTHGPAPLPRSEDGARELKKIMQRPFVLYVGTRVSYKNFGGLLRGFAMAGLAKDYDLMAIGGGAFSDDEKKLIADLGLQAVVKQVGLASGGLLAEAYAAAAVFVYPSFYEGLGLPPLEAMEKGCRVLVSANPACMEVCKDAAAYFDPADDSDLARALTEVLADTEESRRRVERGFEVRQLYSWNPVVEKMLSVYRSLL